MKLTNLLLHCCCAPCSIQCVQVFLDEGIRPDLFWHNPNIHPIEEYSSRLQSFMEFSRSNNLSIIMEEGYETDDFIENTFLLPHPEGNKKERSRCAYCYKTRLELCVIKALENGYNAFSTTLLISPYQDHDLIIKTGKDLAISSGLEFLYRDFREHFRKSQKEARDKSYYMQKYCGCILSREEREK